MDDKINNASSLSASDKRIIKCGSIIVNFVDKKLPEELELYLKQASGILGLSKVVELALIEAADHREKALARLLLYENCSLDVLDGKIISKSHQSAKDAAYWQGERELAWKNLSTNGELNHVVCFRALLRHGKACHERELLCALCDDSHREAFKMILEEVVKSESGRFWLNKEYWIKKIMCENAAVGCLTEFLAADFDANDMLAGNIQKVLEDLKITKETTASKISFVKLLLSQPMAVGLALETAEALLDKKGAEIDELLGEKFCQVLPDNNVIFLMALAQEALAAAKIHVFKIILKNFSESHLDIFQVQDADLLSKGSITEESWMQANQAVSQEIESRLADQARSLKSKVGAEQDLGRSLEKPSSPRPFTKSRI